MIRSALLARAWLFSALLIASQLVVSNAEAQRQISVFRDAEVEALVADYVAPILRAAGIRGSSIQVVLVNERDFNAFVADGRRIFINLGVLLQSDTPNEVIGVLAHETGHLAGAHLTRLRQEISRSQIISAVTMLAGAAAMAAAASAGSSEGVAAGQGIALGGQAAAQRSLLAYQRGEELAADRAAITYLNATGQSAQGHAGSVQPLC
jgi:predicted Zn-dependent protease